MTQKYDGGEDAFAAMQEAQGDKGHETPLEAVDPAIEAQVVADVAESRLAGEPSPEEAEQIAALTAELKGESTTPETTAEIPVADENAEVPAEASRSQLAEDGMDRLEAAKLRSMDIADKENGPETWQMFKDELDAGGADYRGTRQYEDAMQTIFQRSMKSKDYDSLKQAVEIFGKDVLTEERKEGIANAILENMQLGDEKRSLIEATGIDLKEYHDEGLSKIERMVNGTNLVDRSRGFLTTKDLQNWRDLFGITDEEYAEKLREMYFKNPTKYEQSALIPLGFVKNGEWAWK
jgi:hypothetical protein